MPNRQAIASLSIIAFTFFCVAALSYNRQAPSLFSTSGPVQIPALIDMNSLPSEGHDIEEDRILHGKPGVAIQLVSHSLEYLDLHQEKELVLELETQLTSGTLSVTIVADSGIQLLSDQSSWAFELSKNNTLTIPLTIYADANGQHFLNVFTQHIDSNGQPSVRALATELRVGNALALNEIALKNFEKTHVAINEIQGVISLPSQETIF